MIENKNVQKMLMIINQITKKIPEQHQAHIFWSPKTNSDDGKVVGYRLYAYGGYVLRIFLEEEQLIYETNFHVYKDKFFEDLWNEDFEEKINKKELYKRSKNVDTLLGIVDLWETILTAYKKWMYGNGKVKKKQLERGRATTIARNLELQSELKDFYFIEQESRIKVSKKKPDLIGIRNEHGKSIISFIEYKCTNNGMHGVTLTEHFEDMVKFYQDYKMGVCYETLYGQMIDFAKFKHLQLEKTFKVSCIESGEIIFLFSNIGTENGISAQTIYNAVCRLIYDCNKYKQHKENVKFLVLKDENELFTPNAYMNAETLLEHEVFANCNKTKWKKYLKHSV